MDLRPPRHRPGLRGLLLRQSNIHVRVSHAGATRRDERRRPGARSEPPSPTVSDPLRQPVTDDPRWLLRASASTSRASASSPDPDANVAAARRPVLSSRVASRDSDRDLDPAPSSARRGELRASNVGPDEVLRPSSSTPSAPLAAFRAARRRREEYREASSTLDAPALGLARVPEDALARILPDGPSLSCEWSLREDEVVAVVGCTPPPAKYFGLTPYLYRTYRDGSVRTLFASLSDTLSVGASAGETPSRFSRLSTSAGAVPFDADGTRTGVLRGVPCWDSGFAALVGGSRTTLERASIAAGESGFVPGGSDAVNVVGLSRQTSGVGSGLFGLGGGLSPGTLATHAVVLRNAVPEDVSAWEAYAEAPPFVVLRLTPRRRPMLPSPFPRAALIPRETVDERPLAPAVAAVAERVAAFYRAGAGSGAGAYATSTVATGPQVLFDGGQSCVDVGWNCGGDNRDTVYVRGPTFRIPDRDTVVYVVGVNHAAVGNAHYSNVAVYNRARNLGVVAVDDSSFAGTAVSWAAGSAAADVAHSLYVVAFARSCPGASRGAFGAFGAFGASGRSDARAGRSVTPDGALCVEIPEEGFPSAGADEEMILMERPYAHLETTVGPWWTTMAMPTVVVANRVGGGSSGVIDGTF